MLTVDYVWSILLFPSRKLETKEKANLWKIFRFSIHAQMRQFDQHRKICHYAEYVRCFTRISPRARTSKKAKIGQKCNNCYSYIITTSRTVFLAIRGAKHQTAPQIKSAVNEKKSLL